MAGAAREREIFRALKNLKSEDELEVPSFMRQRGMLASRRPAPVVNNTPAHQSVGMGMGRRPMR